MELIFIYLLLLFSEPGNFILGILVNLIDNEIDFEFISDSCTGFQVNLIQLLLL